MRALVWEYVISQGLRYRDLLLDGYVMTKCLVETLSTLSNVKVIVPVSTDLLNVVELDAEIVPVSRRNTYLSILREMSSSCDLCFLIAPPLELVQAYRVVSCEIAGPNHRLIYALSRKDLTLRLCEKLSVPVPDYEIVRDLSELETYILKVGTPCVVKPVDEAGCRSVTLVNSIDEAKPIVKKILDESTCGVALVTRYIPGVPASCSFIVSRKGDMLLETANVQIVRRIGSRFEFQGIVTPAPLKIGEVALSTARKLVKELRNGVRGYINIDLVVHKDRAYVLEINPRISMSFINIAHLHNKEDIARALLGLKINLAKFTNSNKRAVLFRAERDLHYESCGICKVFRIDVCNYCYLLALR